MVQKLTLGLHITTKRLGLCMPNNTYIYITYFIVILKYNYHILFAILITYMSDLTVEITTCMSYYNYRPTIRFMYKRLTDNLV